MQIVKQEGSIPKNKTYSYAHGDLEVAYNGRGGCGIQGVSFLAPKYHWTFSAWCMLRTGDVVATLGGVFRARCDDSEAVLERIPDDKLPKGARLPKWDSITVPFPGTAGFDAVGLKVLDDVDAKPEKETSVLLEIKIGTLVEAMKGKQPARFSARVKAGDILLLQGNGHLVRAVVPRGNGVTRVVGWVEPSPHPIPEADLIRDKKAFIRPEAGKPAKQD